MPNKEFLEEFPLYKKFVTKFNRYTELKGLPKPAIHMHCDQCESSQTFNMVNDYEEVDYSSEEDICKTIVRAKYQCSACKFYTRRFFIKFGLGEIEEEDEKGEKQKQEVVYMEKVGQYPAWSIKIDKELEKLLGDHAEYYKNGLICESQGYGIGAFAYFRRIIEEIIDQLLNKIEGLFEEKDREKYRIALVEVKKTTVAQEKIELVKDLLPSSLRPGGINPLAAIHSALSKGLHAENDEDCLEYADAIRNALVFLVNKLIRTESENKSFTDSMKKILGKKSQK